MRQRQLQTTNRKLERGRLPCWPMEAHGLCGRFSADPTDGAHADPRGSYWVARSRAAEANAGRPKRDRFRPGASRHVRAPVDDDAGDADQLRPRRHGPLSASLAAWPAVGRRGPVSPQPRSGVPGVQHGCQLCRLASRSKDDKINQENWLDSW